MNERVMAYVTSTISQGSFANSLYDQNELNKYFMES